ncbi:hypothetical protein ACJMK2_016775 [Sinanodonta woodiana]|uniref:DCC-interacting protein 13-alpha n=1 Tax=Sinanodonta woodiana TaxID=1069815 RepID=A0ABD3UYA2_SINWO
MPGIEKLHLEDALEDSPQTRNLLSVFERDASILKKYSGGLHNCCQRIMSAQNELCAATQALAQHLRLYDVQKFPLEAEDSVLNGTLKQFASYLDDISSIHQVLAAQFSETMMYPLNKFLQADLEEISTMFEMFQIASHEHEQAMVKYMKLSKKKESERQRTEANDELYVMRKKFHQTSLHYYSSLNALQYKRRCFLLEPLIGFMQAERTFFHMGQDALCKSEIEDFLSNISASIQQVQTELKEETKKTVELIDSLEQQSAHMYYADPPIDMPYIPPNINLSQKAGYLYIRKQQLIGNKWDRCFFFTQGGNLMCQAKEEIAGKLIIDLNEEGVFAEPAESDDRRFTFQINSAKLKKSVGLQAENERERDEWISAINNIVRGGGFVKGVKSTQAAPEPKKKERHPSSSSASLQQSEPESGSPDSNSVTPSSSAPPSLTAPSASMTLETPIQFDLVIPTEAKSLTGPPKRLNPFDQSAVDVLSALDDVLEHAVFSEQFTVRFLGSMEVKMDRGEKLVSDTIRQIMTARAVQNVFKMTESRMIVTNESLRLIDPATNCIRVKFALEDISFWSAHQENNRLLGFITRNRGSSLGTFACHVFETNVPAVEICQAISTATKLAFQALMEKKAAEKIRTVKEREKNLLLANISQLEDKDDDDDDDILSSRLPLSPDGKYLVLTAPEEDDLLPEIETNAFSSQPINLPLQPAPSKNKPSQPTDEEDIDKESEA